MCGGPCSDGQGAHPQNTPVRGCEASGCSWMGQDCPAVGAVREQPALAARLPQAGGKACPGHIPVGNHIHFSPWLPFSSTWTWEWVLEGEKGDMVGVYQWQKRSSVSTTSKGLLLVWIWVWSPVDCFPYCLAVCWNKQLLEWSCGPQGLHGGAHSCSELCSGHKQGGFSLTHQPCSLAGATAPGGTDWAYTSPSSHTQCVATWGLFLWETSPKTVTDHSRDQSCWPRGISSLKVTF